MLRRLSVLCHTYLPFLPQCTSLNLSIRMHHRFIVCQGFTYSIWPQPLCDWFQACKANKTTPSKQAKMDGKRNFLTFHGTHMIELKLQILSNGGMFRKRQQDSPFEWDSFCTLTFRLCAKRCIKFDKIVGSLCASLQDSHLSSTWTSISLQYTNLKIGIEVERDNRNGKC